MCVSVPPLLGCAQYRGAYRSCSPVLRVLPLLLLSHTQEHSKLWLPEPPATSRIKADESYISKLVLIVKRG